MFTKAVCLLLIITLSQSALIGPAFAASVNYQQPAADEAQIEKVRTQIYRLGEGPDARVEVRMRDNTKLKGYIRESGKEDFVVRDTRQARDVRVEYTQVAHIKGPRQFRVSPFVVRMGLIAAGIAIPLAILASQSSRDRTIRVTTFKTN